jgi:hypothetical protein
MTDLAVRSQWDPSSWNVESAEAAPAWPVAMAVRPAKQEETGGRWPCLGWKMCLLIGS